MAPVHHLEQVPMLALLGVGHLGESHSLPQLEVGEQEDREVLFRGVLGVDLVSGVDCYHHSRFQLVSHQHRGLQ